MPKYTEGVYVVPDHDLPRGRKVIQDLGREDWELKVGWKIFLFSEASHVQHNRRRDARGLKKPAYGPHRIGRASSPRADVHPFIILPFTPRLPTAWAEPFRRMEFDTPVIGVVDHVQ